MSEFYERLVESAAKAIYEEDDPFSEAFTWEDGTDEQVKREAYRRVGRAAVQSTIDMLKEPSEEILRAGNQTSDWENMLKAIR